MYIANETVVSNMSSVRLCDFHTGWNYFENNCMAE